MEKETFQVIGRPYKEVSKESYVIREFSQNTPEDEFVWHRDREDRVIEAIGETDWQFQLDNELPVSLLNSKLFIPKGIYHRIIKGSDKLKLKIYKDEQL